jgi:adenylate cyclase class 2
MYEVELKVRAAHGPVREALESRGATPVGRVNQHDTYYDAPHRDFAETDEALRLRRETREEGSDGSAGGRGTADPTTRLTYKGPLVESASKTREEHETGISDPDAADALLGALGFSPAAVVEKSRERFACGEYAVVLDTPRSSASSSRSSAKPPKVKSPRPARGRRSCSGSSAVTPPNRSGPPTSNSPSTGGAPERPRVDN